MVQPKKEKISKKTIYNQTDFVLKSGSSNLLVNMKKFIVALRISALSVMLNDVFPKSNVCVKMESIFSSNLQLMLPIVLRIVHH